MGHLFQNRYKSIVCEEDAYLLELVRYIHLNPLRVGSVNDLRGLDKYPWCGHSAILGRRKNPLIPSIPGSSKKKVGETNIKSAIRNPYSKISLAEKTIQDILLLFGSKTREARRRYRQFVKNGVDQGKRPELQGGGLVRSAGGKKAGLLGRKREEREKGDERILGSGNFVEEILGQSDEIYEIRMRNRISVDELIRKVATNIDVDMDDLKSSKRNRKVSYARAVISYLAVNQLGCTASQVARKLGISGMGVGKCVERGKKSLDKSEIIREYVS
jgi:hypothetical protein